MPTSKQRGRVRRSTGKVVRAWSNQNIGLLGGCRRARSRGAAVGSGINDAEGLKRSRLATRAVRVPCVTVGN